MEMREMKMWLLSLLALPVFFAAAPGRAQNPPPPGNRIVAHDGDVILVDDDARVSIVRRRTAHVRAVFNGSDRWLLILVDRPTSRAGTIDGLVDWVYHYADVEGTWPFDRWEGDTTLEEYSSAGPDGPGGGLGIVTPQGLVQVLGRRQESLDPNAGAVVSFRRAGSSLVSGVSFDVAERWYVAELKRNDGVVRSPSGPATSVSLSAAGPAATGGYPAGAVRVGGNVRAPARIVDVPPVLPEEAARAGIRGTVILEVTIDVDGTVKDARVLRSVPILDAAALDAVRQWRYEPTTVLGKSVPVIMTVTVSF
jgi:TonB family protein